MVAPVFFCFSGCSLLSLRSEMTAVASSSTGSSSLLCWTCSGSIQSSAVKVPLAFNAKHKRFDKMHGMFCCFPCGQRYVQFSNRYPDRIRRAVANNIANFRYQALKLSEPELARQFTHYDLFVRTSPSPLLLKDYGGMLSRNEYALLLQKCARLHPRPISCSSSSGEALPGELRERVRKYTEYSRIMLIPNLPGMNKLPGPSYNCYMELPVSGAVDERISECDERSTRSTVFAQQAQSGWDSSRAEIDNVNVNNKKNSEVAGVISKLQKQPSLVRVTNQQPNRRKKMLPISFFKTNSNSPPHRVFVSRRNKKAAQKPYVYRYGGKSTRVAPPKPKQRPLSDFFN